MKRIYKYLIKKFPFVKEIVTELNYYQSIQGFRPGHYYSPIVDTDSLDKSHFNTVSIEGIDLNSDAQFLLLNELKQCITNFPFEEQKNNTHRYFSENDFYSYNDAVFLYGLIKHFKPKRIIEIGSGFSSALMLDTNSIHFNNKIEITFIEPNAERLSQLLFKVDTVKLINKKVQEAPLEIFTSLQKNDILFIDSSHVAKTGSDLNHVLFKILPILKEGVLIHFHDIFYPFEYPEQWVIKEKRNWNENYFLKSFLMYNNNFKIILFNTFLSTENKAWFDNNIPKYSNNKRIFGSIWLVKSKM